ncbi:MAG: acyl-CoA dehydrogenase [Deltaproteobacteria bacterium HGW-Deltaproteobacteria-14]|jgi:butyryl-CoA dehydrogenase/short/branched chain acyl-CoA dehydrogenase|nr:MAG: acyl-CoA dehydrogenase [Deltaproteobacteria bacterium HGW-Deltaproteobacteria-14]
MTVRPLTQLNDEEKMFRDAALAFAREQVAPHAHAMDERQELRRDIIDACFELGFMGIEVPEQYGGSGSSFFNAILVIEALARVDASLAVFVDVQNTLVLNALLRWADDAQKERYLPRMVKDLVGAYALSEASSGSDAFALKTTATDKGDHWVLNGSKLWITNGKEAGLFIVMATVDPSLGYKGITAFLVEKGFEGFRVGKKEDKLGIRASSTCELVFDECVVPKENVLGQVGKGYKVAIETLNEGRIGIGAQMIGIAQGAFDYAMSYLRERKQFGTRIADFQGIQFQYADLATEIEAARLLVYNAARLKDAGLPFLKEAAMAKLYSSIVAEKAASTAIDFLGGVGFTKEYPAEKFFRDAKIGQIYEGTSNMQRMTIAKQLLDAAGG